MRPPTVAIRPLAGIDEIVRCEELQQEIWAMPDMRDVVPAHLLITAQKNGGLLLGAFDGAQMVGLLFGFLGRASDGTFMHCSHMMGIHPAYRGRGLGERLKLRQRDLVLAQGLDLVTWTYDPLETANARLNIGKLGAICRTYLPNLYGELHDTLNQGLPTDRFEVEWRLGSDRVVERAAGARLRPAFETLLAAGGVIVNRARPAAPGRDVPAGWTAPSDDPVALVEVPVDYQRLKRDDIAAALAWRTETRAIFQSYLAAGYTVYDIVTRQRGRRRAFYVLLHGTE